MTRRTRTRRFRRSSRCCRRTVRRTCSCPARRRRVRREQRLRRAGARCRPRSGCRRDGLDLQPVPHHGAVCADPGGAAQRPQPSLGRDGHDHRDRDVGSRGRAECVRTRRLPLATTLKLNGYSTAQFGKCHEVPPWQTSPVGPFDAWPSGGGGFEYFYGFIGGENNQYYPALYDGTVPGRAGEDPGGGLPPHRGPGRPCDRLGQRTQKALAPDKPFFVYFAPGATHAPHHVPLEWADKYAGQFADGWDAQRESTFERQKQRGVVPADAELTPRPDADPGLGRDGRRAQARAGAADGGLRRLPRAHRLPRRPPARRHRGPSVPSRTRSSTTSSATTAPRPRAPSTARSTRWPTSTAWPRSRRRSSWPR